MSTEALQDACTCLVVTRPFFPPLQKIGLVRPPDRLGLIVLPLHCLLVNVLVCMISLKRGGGTSTMVPPCFLPPVKY